MSDSYRKCLIGFKVALVLLVGSGPLAGQPASAPPPARAAATSVGKAGAAGTSSRTLRTPATPVFIDWTKEFGPRAAPTGARLAAGIEKIFSVKLTDLKPGIVIFPVTDQHGVVRPDGIGLAYQAAISVSLASAQPQVGIFPETALAMLQDAGCDRPGSKLTDILRVACTKCADAQLSLSASLTPQPSGWDLQVAFYDVAGMKSGETLHHSIATGKLNQVPCLIASDACDRLELKLTADERAQLMLPPVATDEDSAFVSRMLTASLDTYSDAAEIEDFLHSNPRCQAIWRRMSSVGSDPASFIGWHRNMDGVVPDPRLEINFAFRLLQYGFNDYGLSEAIRLVPQLPGDRGPQLLLMQLISYTDNPELLARALDAWKAQDPRYSARFARGRFLSELVNNQIRNSPEESVSQPMTRLLEMAQAELQAAIEMNPQDWQAHNELISLATIQKKPREEIERHFAEVTAISPTNLAAYRRKMLFLARTVPNAIDEVAEFAEQCVQTGLWDEGIPQLMVQAVDMVTCDPATAATNYAAFRNEKLWKAMQTYFAASQKQPWRDSRKQALNNFARWAASSGHGRVAVPIFEKLDADYGHQVLSRAVFETPTNYQFFRDLAYQDLGKVPPNTDRFVRLQLGLGGLDESAQLLAQAEVGKDRHLLPTYRAALALAQKLQADHRVNLSGKNLLESMDCLGGNFGDTPGPPKGRHREPFLSANEEGLFWQTGGNFRALWLCFPVGLRHVALSGEVEVTGDIERFGFSLHTRALRDTVTVMYFPSQEVRVSRSRRLLAAAPVTPGKIPFRFELGAKTDVLEPVPGVTISTPVVEDIPSGFAIEGVWRGPGSVRLTNVKLEALDN